MSANLLVRASFSFGLSLWVVFVFIVSQIAVAFLMAGLAAVFPIVGTLNSAVSATLDAVVVYALSIAILIATPYLTKKKKVTLETLGLQRLLSWSDMGIGLLALLPYFIISAGLMGVVGMLWSGFDPSQEQSIPFSNLQQRYEILVAFITLVVLAPLAEETLFRGYLLGKMKERINKWVAVLLTALVFGALHLPGALTDHGITLQWAVAADTLSLGLVLGSLRIFTGSIWAGVLLHMLKNAIAFYFLFIYPTMPGTL